MEVKIIEVEPMQVAVLEHLGDPMRVSNTVATFIEWRKASGLSDYTQRGTYGIPYNDPLVTPGEEFRFDVCGELNPQANGTVPENPQGVIGKTLPGGRCAVVRHVGAYDRISDSVYFFIANGCRTAERNYGIFRFISATCILIRNYRSMRSKPIFCCR